MATPRALITGITGQDRSYLAELRQSRDSLFPHALAEAFAIVDLGWREHVVVDPKLFRPVEVHALPGNVSKAKPELGWQPQITFSELVKEMFHSGLALESAAVKG